MFCILTILGYITDRVLTKLVDRFEDEYKENYKEKRTKIKEHNREQIERQKKWRILN